MLFAITLLDIKRCAVAFVMMVVPLHRSALLKGADEIYTRYALPVILTVTHAYVPRDQCSLG